MYSAFEEKENLVLKHSQLLLPLTPLIPDLNSCIKIYKKKKKSGEKY